MEPLFHLLLPLGILLILFPNLDKFKVGSLSLLTQVMDLDIFLFHDYHRMIFHNFTFMLIVALIVFYFLGKTGFLVSLFYLLSHLVLDSSEVGSSLLWPFYSNLLGVNFNFFAFPNWSIDLDFFSIPFDASINAGEICAVCPYGSLVFVLIGTAIFVKIYTLRKK
jgi:hypothetical protein